LDDEFGGRFRIILTHVHLSLSFVSPLTYTFNSLVFYSRVFHSRTQRPQRWLRIMASAGDGSAPIFWIVLECWNRMVTN